MTEELKPCGHCAAIPKRYKDRYQPQPHYGYDRFRIYCDGCGINTGWRGSPEQAEESWNRRPAPSLDGLYEAADAVIEEMFPETKTGDIIEFTDSGNLQHLVAKAVWRWLMINRAEPAAAGFAGPDYAG